MKKNIILVFPFLISSCSLFNNPLNFEQTYAEQQAGYSYIPVEPSSVDIYCESNGGNPSNNCITVSKKSLLDALPDNSVRIATRQVSGKISAGIPSIGTDVGVAGNSYEVIIDFVNTQTVNIQFVGKWRVSVPENITKLNRCYPLERSVLELSSIDKFETWTLKADLLKKEEYFDQKYYDAQDAFDNRESTRNQRTSVKFKCPESIAEENRPQFYEDIQVNSERFNIPVYYGIGLRLKANVTVLEGNVNLSSLPALTAAVSSEKATGTMSVQTIGISGKAARSNLLLLDKIDATTIQNAIQVLASIKASIESGDTTISPRIVGFHNTIGAGSQGVNLIHSLLAGGKHHLTIEQDSYANGDITDKKKTGS
jgi:hypothetical protein